jgi:polysaccharide pyruvyl transferase WcaK-like protein
VSQPRQGPVRIVVEPGSYRCQNMGDVAMLQVAVARLTRLWPDAEIHVFTGDEGALVQHCPRVVPLPTIGRAQWLTRRPWLPGPVPPPPPHAARWQDRQLGTLRRAALGVALRVRRRDRRQLEQFVDTFGRADLVLICGQGSMGDATAGHASSVLDILQLAAAAGTSTAMLGQGIGPMDDSELRRRAAEVLPGVGWIGLREGPRAAVLLGELGVPGDRLTVTGDDAIELAWTPDDPGPGGGLGVNVRVSGNAGVDRAMLGVLAAALRSEARSRGVPLVPAPIARGQAGDANVLREVLGEKADQVADLATPAAVIGQIGRSRVLVTGAYHAAVFALAQGIPVVCLSDSEYYQWKFTGLRDLFGEGCEIVSVRGGDLGPRLGRAVSDLWDRALHLRGPLRRQAASQVARGRAAYERLADLVPASPGPRTPLAASGRAGWVG